MVRANLNPGSHPYTARASSNNNSNNDDDDDNDYSNNSRCFCTMKPKEEKVAQLMPWYYAFFMWRQFFPGIMFQPFVGEHASLAPITPKRIHLLSLRTH